MNFRCFDHVCMDVADALSRRAPTRVPDDTERLLEAELLLHRLLVPLRLGESALVSLDAGDITIELPAEGGASLESRQFFLGAVRRGWAWRLVIAPASWNADALVIDTDAATPALAAGDVLRQRAAAKLDAVLGDLLEQALTLATDVRAAGVSGS